MNRCFVCGTSLEGHEAQCPKCLVEQAVLVRIRGVHDRPRFLFGSHKESDIQIDAPKKSMGPVRPSASSELQRARSRPQLRRPRVMNAKPEPQAEVSQADVRDLIGDRDQMVPLTPAVRRHPLALTRALFWDLACCLILNMLVLNAVLWVSPRNFGEMLRFSLIPLLFVLVCFTVLYFWLFLGFFQTTLGGLIAQRLHEEQAT